MITSRRTLIIGICIILIPFLGFPSSWKNFLVVASGFALVATSIKIVIPKKIVKKVRRRETVTPVFRESIIPTPRKEKITEAKTPEDNEK